MLTAGARTRALAPILVLACASCPGAPAAAPERAEPPRAPAGPYALVLGTAQDGGLPQIGCDAPCCASAREDPARRRLVASALIVDPRSGRRWLLDASPDLDEQVELARGHGAPRSGTGRPALFDGVFLTHAHAGHYVGLWRLGREAYGSAPQAVYGSERMVRFLAENEPWELLVRHGHVELAALAPGERLALADDLSIEPLVVPHRGESTDTFAYLVRGPRRSLLYLPDIDKWEAWERPIEDALASVDLALLDGSFFDEGEVPGRSMAEIPHPFVVESIARFAPLPPDERAKVRFFHLNHTNPVADPTSGAAARVRAAGMSVAREGDRFEL